MISPNTTPEHDDQDYLPARMLNEFAYCPQLFYLEHVDGLFAHNTDTIEGAARHARVDEKTTSLPASKRKRAAKEDDVVEVDSEQKEIIHARSVTLSSERYGILAKLDLVESDGMNATPVDYKRGSPKKLDDGSLGAWDPERIQICVQALVLRENGFDSPKCPRCSLVGICLPDETSYCRHSSSGDSLKQPLLFDIGPTRMHSLATEPAPAARRIRQMVTARDERKPLYLNTQGYWRQGSTSSTSTG